MVWIYVDGFTFTDRNYNPAGLIARSKENSDGVIYVSINYRGGPFGFLSGPELRANGTANAGLLDQRFALEWVQKHIPKFGGDPNRVTVFGQSAGAASIMHQITAYGGRAGPAPFSQAIMASPAFQPINSNFQQSQVCTNFLTALNVTSIQEAHQLPYDKLVAANTKLVTPADYGQFTFSATVDGSFVPGLPGQLLHQGEFDYHVKILIGHNSNEASYWINPNATSEADFTANLQSAFLTIPSSITNYISGVLYPYPNYSNINQTAAIGYTTPSDSAFSAIQPEKYAYEFSVPPRYHGEDVPYFYYNGPSPLVKNETIALAMQTYYTHFAITGLPNNGQYPDFQQYGTGSNVLGLNVTGIAVKKDPADNSRCRWWQQALYF